MLRCGAEPYALPPVGAIGLETELTYDDYGRVVGVKDPAGRWNMTHYDSAGRVDWTLANASVPTDQSAPLRDARKQYLWQDYASTRPGANVGTQYQYDALGRVVKVIEHGFLAGTMVRPAPKGLPGFTAMRTRVSEMRYLGPESFTPADKAKAPLQASQFFAKVQVIQNSDQLEGIATLPDTDLESWSWYDVAGNLVRTIDPLNRETSFSYDALNQPSEQVGNEHDGNPRTDAPWSPLVGQTDQDLRQIMHYTVGGELDDLIVNAGAAGQTFIGTTFNPAEPDLNRKTDYQYQASVPGALSALIENVATGTTPDLNRTTRFEYDAATGWQIRQRDALNRWTNLEYNTLGQPDLTCRNATGPTGSHSCPLANDYAETNVATTMAYDELGQPLLTTNAKGEVVRTEYNAFGQLVATALNYVGNGTETTSEQNVWTRYTYDPAGRIVSQLTPPDATGRTAATTYAYNDTDGVVTITGPARDNTQAPEQTRMGYDGRGALRWTECVNCVVNCMGTPQASRWTGYDVDGLGRTVRMVANFEDGIDDSRDDRDIITLQRYDKGGRLVATEEERSGGTRVTTYMYDLLDRLLQITESAIAGCTDRDCNLVTSYRYDRLGNHTQIIDALGQVRTFTYDAADQRKQEAQVVDGVNRVKTWEYDAGGRLLWERNARDTKFDVGYTYNGLDALTKITYEGTKTIDMKVDVLGRRRELTKDATTTTFVYNKLGAMTDVFAPEGHTGYQYDPRGKRTGMTYPSGTTVTYQYNNDDTLKQVLQGSTQLATYAYTPEGLPHLLERSNGAETTYCYDPLGRVTSIITRNAAGTQRSRFDYDWGRGGGIRSANQTFGTGIVPTPVPATGTPGPTQTGTRTSTPTQPSATPTKTPTRTPTETEGPIYTATGLAYTYDRIGRLTAVTGEQTALYEYDQVGNRTSMREQGITRKYEYNEAGEVRGWTYDAAGNLIMDSTNIYTYDGLSRLTRVAFNSLGQPTTSTPTDYHYNGDGVLVGMTRNGVTTTYVQDQAAELSQVLEVRTGSTVAQTALYGLERLATVNSSGTRSWPVADLLGSQRQTLDNTAAATVLEEATFTPSGQPLQDTNTAKFGFTGELQDGETDLVNLRARWYHPGTGRFLSRDPFPGYAALPYSQHPYQYAYGDPLTNTDPSGMITIREAHKKQAGKQAGRMLGKGSTRATAYERRVLNGYVNQAKTSFLDGLRGGPETWSWKGAQLLLASSKLAVREGVDYLLDPEGYKFKTAMRINNVEEALHDLGIQMATTSAALLVDPERTTLRLLQSVEPETWGAIGFEFTLFVSTLGGGAESTAARTATRLESRMVAGMERAVAREEGQILNLTDDFLRGGRGVSDDIASNLDDAAKAHDEAMEAVKKMWRQESFEERLGSDDWNRMPNSTNSQIWGSNKDIGYTHVRTMLEDIRYKDPDVCIYVLTGCHGSPDGYMKGEKMFFVEDLMYNLDINNIKLINIMSARRGEIKSILNSGKVVVCAWCWSENSIYMRSRIK